jgi:hypothetical protein
MKKEDDVTVFIVIKETLCEKCGRVIKSGGTLRVIKDKAYCLKCAKMNKLVFLPSGNATLTVRARKLSPVSAVVLKWNGSRRRYERKGAIVDKKALKEAGKMCRSDAPQRAKARKKAAVYALKVDKRYIDSFSETIIKQYPGCETGIAREISEHACRKYSGRVGRSAAAKNLEPKAIKLAVRAYVRHKMTVYDSLFEKGYSKAEARKQISEQLDEAVEKLRLTSRGSVETRNKI